MNRCRTTLSSAATWRRRRGWGPAGIILALASALSASESPSWNPLFNGRDLTGWDTWLAPRPTGGQDSIASRRTALGLNTDPLGVFTVVTNDGAAAIRISGEVYGALTSTGEYQEPSVPYRGETPGERVILWTPGDPWLTAKPGDGVTSPIDPEQRGEGWNICEVVAWGGTGIHLLNGQVALVLMNPHYRERDRVTPLNRGKIQLQSEGAELFYRTIEARSLSEIPPTLLDHVPAWPAGDPEFRPLLGEDDRDDWAQCGPGHFVLSQGVATGVGGMGLWWYTNRMFTNFVLRGEWVQEGDLADSGVFVRFPNPGDDPWVAVNQGHEMEIGDPNPEDPTWRTGSIYPFKASVTANARPYGEWNDYEMICVGHDYSVRINGRLVTTWTDPGRRTLAGYIGLQNYDDGKIVRHRNLRILSLP